MGANYGDPGGRRQMLVDPWRPQEQAGDAREALAARGDGLVRNLREMERTREAYWLRYPATSPVRLRWRAHAARHALHIASGQQVLEIGAGSGLWTEHIARLLHGDVRVTAAVFNADLAERAAARQLKRTHILLVRQLTDLRPESFDYVLGTAILSHDLWEENLAWLGGLLRPGGRVLFFEANYANPQVFAKAKSRRIARWAGNANCQIALRKQELLEASARCGLTDTGVVPYDILHPRTPRRLIPTVQRIAFVLEHLPGIRDVCGTLLFSAARPGPQPSDRRPIDLARHAMFTKAVSFVVPCHNEAMNIPGLVRALTDSYDGYIREIVLVNDNSGDDTVAVVGQLMADDPRIRLIDRAPPPGVGRALRDGFAAATGEYILTMDCDFAMLVPEFVDLFDAVARGHEGAIGSRFSYDSILLNYPAAKLVGNRGFHLLLRLLTRLPVRDISNNLKLYRGDILRELEISQDGFAANAETGLRPLLEGRDIVEVPIAWINRSSEMGASTFNVTRVAPGYFLVLLGMMRRYGIRRR